MQHLSSFLFAFSASCDSIIVGLSYGTKKVRIAPINNLLIALISGFGTFLAMYFGKACLSFIPMEYANVLGSGILLLFAFYLLRNSVKKNPNSTITEQQPEHKQDMHRYEYALRHPEVVDKNHSNKIELKETLVLGIVLCVNNIGLGIGASITGVNIFITSITSIIFSLFFLPIGYYIGQRIYSEKLTKHSEIISICILIALAIYELFV